MLYEVITYLQRNDILPHLMLIDTMYGDQKPKVFASSAINYLKKQSFSYDDFYFGPQITRDRIVITSYSIHYTKLYENTAKASPLQGQSR